MDFEYEIKEVYVYKGKIEANSKKEALSKIKKIYEDGPKDFEIGFVADACSFDHSEIKIKEHLYVIARNDYGIEYYYTGDKYIVFGEQYGAITDCITDAKVYVTEKTAQRALNSLASNCMFGDLFYIKEMK